jgi:ParB-like chromosome segregation protein Spo0J
MPRVALVVVPENINESLKGLKKSISKLKLDSKNARKHPARSLESIKDSLANFGQQKPIVITKDGVVVAGNGTLQAAKALGWKNLACVTFEDAKKARAYAIADNRASELSEWDTEELLHQLEEMHDLNLGFNTSELQDLIDQQLNSFVTERIDISELKAHPRNYRSHPEDQLEHIMRSIEQHGFYRNVVVANDNTILAGHGVVEAAKKLGKTRVPIIRFDIDPEDQRALKIMASDNEIQRLAENDDAALVKLLQEIMGEGGLLGTGHDRQSFEILNGMVEGRIKLAGEVDPYEEWKGMPDFENENVGFRKIIMHFDDQAAVDAFAKLIGQTFTEKTRATWYPEKENNVFIDKRYASES